MSNCEDPLHNTKRKTDNELGMLAYAVASRQDDQLMHTHTQGDLNIQAHRKFTARTLLLKISAMVCGTKIG